MSESVFPGAPPTVEKMSGGEAKAMVTDSGGEISMSIEETNRVRASLGLKPLDMTPKAHKEGSKDAPIDAGAARAKEEAEAEAEAMRQKIAEMKRQRLAQSKVMSKKSLGEADDDDDAAAWVSRARKKQKKAVDDMAKRMAELDEQDGEGDYTSNDLRGMKVLKYTPPLSPLPPCFSLSLLNPPPHPLQVPHQPESIPLSDTPRTVTHDMSPCPHRPLPPCFHPSSTPTQPAPTSPVFWGSFPLSQWPCSVEYECPLNPPKLMRYI